MMKAALLTAFDPLLFKGGIERYTLQLLKVLSARGVAVDIYHTGLVRDNLGFSNPILGKLYALGRSFYGLDDRYDFLLSHSFYGLGYFPPRISAYTIYHSSHVAFDKCTQNVISPVSSLEFTYLCGYMGEMVCGFDRAKIAVSTSVRDEVAHYYGYDDVRLVESGIDVGLFRKAADRDVVRSRHGIPRDAFVGIFVGRWDRTKGKDIIEDVAARMPGVFWLLVLATASEPCSLEGRGNVAVLREVPYEDMPFLYSAADFMLFPSRYEGFGLVIIEAMACGVPVIVGDVGIAKNICHEDPFRMLRIPVHADREEAVTAAVRAISEMKGDPDLVSRIAEEGRRVVEESYTISRWERSLLHALDLS